MPKDITVKEHLNMEGSMIKLFPFLILINVSLADAQEWECLKAYRNETGISVLQAGCWLKSDRTRQTDVWKEANRYNLSVENGSRKYHTIDQLRDFYLWFDEERRKQGHEIKWIGVAAIVAGQLSSTDKGFIRVFIVRNKEIVKFVNEGSEKVLAFAFPQLKELYFSTKPLKGKNAENWDIKYGTAEQCDILDPLYKKMSPKAFKKLNKMAEGKGVFRLGIPKELRFEGQLDDCRVRVDHAIKKIFPYYNEMQKNK